jgi:hypothetical protein
MMSLSKAISLNNEGVTFMQNGNLELADRTLRNALHEIQNYLSLHKSMLLSNETIPPLLFEWTGNISMNSAYEVSAPTNNAFIFRRAICIIPSNQKFESEKSCVHTSALIMYNLGLASMFFGITMNCSDSLKKSIKLFEMVLVLNNQTEDSSGKSYNDDILKCAVGNNLGWIHSEFCNYKMSQIHFKVVSQIMKTLHQKMVVDPTDWEGFVTNIIFGSYPTLAAAA